MPPSGTWFRFGLLSAILLLLPVLGSLRGLSDGLPGPPAVAPQIPVPIFRGNEVILVSPGNDLVAEVQSYDDEMFAYLMTSYLRGTRTFANWDVLLTARQS